MLLWPGGCSTADRRCIFFKDNFLGPLGDQQLLLPFPPAPAFALRARSGDAQARVPTVWPGVRGGAVSAAPRISGSGSLRGESGGESSERQIAAPAAVAGRGWGGTGGLGGELGVGDAETCEWGLSTRRLGANSGARGSPVARRGGDSCGGVRRLSRCGGRRSSIPPSAALNPCPSPPCVSGPTLCCVGGGVLRGRGAVHGGAVEREESIFFTLSPPARL